MKTKWKITAIIFIVLTILLILISLCLFGASYTSYNQMYENACGQGCCAYDYSSFELAEDGNCYCTNPKNISNYQKIVIGRNGIAYVVKE